MNAKVLLPALLIAFAAPQDAAAQTSTPASSASGSDQVLNQNMSQRSAARQRTISRQAAAGIAQREVRRIEGRTASQRLRVTGIRREDDFGAWWEVEVTIPRLNVEYDVYINRTGQIVNVVRKNEITDRRRPRTNTPAADSGTITENALAYITQLTGRTDVRVTGIEAEDDYGAHWEVEVTLADGLEYDVYVARDGRVIRAEENGFNYDTWTPGDGVDSIGRYQAAANAVAHIQQETGESNARVTDIDYEDSHGAWWEVEITMPTGMEYDVYVAKDGRVVRVEEKGMSGSITEPGNTTPAPGNGTATTGRDQAAAIALAHIQTTTRQSNARVTGTSAEDDFGARWEVEVTLPNGREFDVYVAEDGRVVRVRDKGLVGSITNPRHGAPSSGGGAPAPGNGTASTGRDQAAAIALAHIRKTTGQSNARVTGVTAEDDFGARWEVEVTLANRQEFDVYVANNGRVVRVVRSSQ